MTPLTKLALEWAVRCFGAEHVYNNPVRTLRLAEEGSQRDRWNGTLGCMMVGAQ